MKYPNFNEEKKLWRKGYRIVVGIDEAGRGPLAGPVVAAAVMLQIFNDKFLIQKQFQNFKFKKLFKSLKLKIKNLQLRDSKKLTPKKREKLFRILTKNPAIKWGVNRVSGKIIDQINIKNAAELAMERALKNLEKKLGKKADFLIIDGNQLKNYKLKTINYKLIIKADEKVFSCAAASIIAKITRDRIIARYHERYPQYGFDKHKGYPTKFHKKMLKKYGPCKIHRKSFRPVTLLKKLY